MSQANYMALNLLYYYQFSFFCSDVGHKGDHILSHSLFTIRKMGIGQVQGYVISSIIFCDMEITLPYCFLGTTVSYL